jgi:hypothetical protein
VGFPPFGLGCSRRISWISKKCFKVGVRRRLDTLYVHLYTASISVTPTAILWLLDELEANRRSRRTAWSTLQRLRKFLEANEARISIPDDRNFETEGEAIESGLRRTLEGRDMVMRSLIRAVYRFRGATLVAEKKDDFGSALQNLYRELQRTENLVGPS